MNRLNHVSVDFDLFAVDKRGPQWDERLRFILLFERHLMCTKVL